MRYIFTFFSLLFSIVVNSQNITGNWEGVLAVQGNELPIVFHITQDESGKYAASFDSPKQKAYNIPCSDAFVFGDSVILIMKSLKGQYAGKLNENKKTLAGTWSQSGYEFPLEMNKTSETVATKKLNRPQTPTPPYPYKSEEVVYSNADKSIKYGATFTVPLLDPNVDYFRAPIYPVVILITGSGPQDRDETIFDHKPFAVIADHLTREGIAVLRVDDRGVGKTTGSFGKATTADFAKDVEAGIEFLKTREDADSNNIGLIGHSEGGISAPMVASRRKDVRFIILLAGPGRPVIDMMEQQNADVMTSQGIGAADIDLYRPLYRDLVATIINAKDSANATQQAISLFKKWQTSNTAATVRNTTGVTSDKSMIAFINVFVNDLTTPWFKYFMKLNPADYLSKITCPVLALNGEKDIQVSAGQNLVAIDLILKKANHTKYMTKQRPGLNHLFQHCKTCTVDEYEQLEESFDTATLKIMADWIKNGRFN